MTRTYALSACLLAALLGGCQDKEKSATPTAAPVADQSIVTANPDLVQRVKIAAAAETEISETLRLPARVEVDGQRMARIGAAVTGRVVSIQAMPGQNVRRGETLATLHSTELSTAQLAFIKAASQQELQQRSVERAKQLFAADVIGSAELQKRESELAQAEAETRAASDQLKVLGMSEAAITRLAHDRVIHSFTAVTATLDGTVIERNVAQGQVVQPADALFVVADLSRVWLVAEVPEQQAGAVRRGEAAQAEIAALEGRKIEGRLIYVADTVAPETRTITVRMEVANQDRTIKPEMLASMLISGKSQRRLAVPAAAVVRDENRDYVFVQMDANRFQLRRVTLGKESGGFVPVLEGLKAGEGVVTEGAFHLNNERRRKELEG